LIGFMHWHGTSELVFHIHDTLSLWHLTSSFLIGNFSAFSGKYFDIKILLTSSQTARGTSEIILDESDRKRFWFMRNSQILDRLRSDKKHKQDEKLRRFFPSENSRV
jgi:hypothetical protein